MILNKEVGAGNSNKQSRIFGLDLMRTAAISLVVVGHTTWLFPKHPIISPLLALMSYFGVEIFFVLSGFLIGRILYHEFTNSNFDSKIIFAFLKRRWFRTIPNYLLILIVNIIVATFIGYDIDALWRYFFFLQNFAGPMHRFFPESWSLSVEEFAYVILPTVLFASLLIFKKSNRKKLFLYVVLFLIMIFVFAKIVYHFQHVVADMLEWNVSIKSVVIYRLDAIFIGVLCSWIYLHFPRFWKKNRYALAVGGITLAGFFTIGIGYLQWNITNAPFFWNVIYLPLSSVLPALFLPLLSELKTAPSAISKPVTFISLISYSIYLLHYGVVLNLMRYFWTFNDLSTILQSLFILFYFGITIVLSALLYHFYEKPFLQMGRSSLKS